MDMQVVFVRKMMFLWACMGLCTAQAIQITAYSLHGTTASGKRAGKGKAAVSRDLLKKYPYGTVIKLVGVGGKHCGGFNTAPLLVADTMRRDIRKTVDVWLPHKKARAWGRCHGRIVVLKKARS